MNLKTTVNATVSIRQFDTDVIIEELYNRVYDSMHDEEPQYDPTLNEMPRENKNDILDALRLYCKETHTQPNKTMTCWVCNEELIWGGDHDFEEDETHFDGHTMMTNLSCPQCESYVEVYHGKE